MLIRCPYCKSYNANFKEELDSLIDLYQCDDCKENYYVEVDEDKMKALDVRKTKCFTLINR